MSIAKKNTKRRGGFTVIEVLVAVIVFATGLAGAYLLINSGLSLAAKGKDEIVAGNLLREQVELVHNLRDTNWLRHRYWDSIVESRTGTTTEDRLRPGVYILDTSTNPSTPILVRPMPLGTVVDMTTITRDRLKGNPDYQLCREVGPTGRYTHTCMADSIRTPYSAYIQVSTTTVRDASGADVVVPNSWNIEAFIVSSERGYRTYRLAFVITDWKRE